MKDIFVFDFDGTITYKDTLLKFVEFAKGKFRLYISLILFSPLLVLMKMGLINNGLIKQRFLAFHFKNTPLEEFTNICDEFAKKNQKLLIPKAVNYIRNTLLNGNIVVILTASAENWVAPFFKNMPVKIIGTQLNVVNNKLSGKFLTPNCYGPQKVMRFYQVHPSGSFEHLYMFGDSRGDYEMFEIADKYYYKHFTKK